MSVPRRSVPRRLRLAVMLLVFPGSLLTACGPVEEDRGAPAPPAVESSEVVWDAWGVPHVYGTTLEDVAFGYGWAQMRSHGDDLLRLYGQARGRAAEYWGEEHLALDRMLHTLGIAGAGEEALEAQSVEFRRWLEAFVEGVNAHARAHPDRLEDENRAVLPVRPADPLLHGLRLQFIFATLTGSEPPVMDVTGSPTVRVPGSNGWSIAPSRSASGNALHLQNPHLPWTTPVMRFYEAHLRGPGMDLYGVTILGFPTVVIGFNDRLGWTHTTNTIDPLDLYRLELVDGGYRFDGSVRGFETGRRVLRIRRDDGSTAADTLRIRRSVHGPVVQMGDTTALALRSPVLDLHRGFEQWWRMGRARNLEDFRSALRRMQLTTQNVIYADADGHVYYRFNGTVPVRPGGDFRRWLRPVPGDTSAWLWTEIHAFGDLPEVVDPAGGFVQNSNSPPWLASHPPSLDPSDYPAYVAPRWLLMREQRGLEMLRSDSSVTMDELVEMRYSNRMLLADRLLDDLLPAARSSGSELAGRAADVLERWDRRAGVDSRGAVLFQAWARGLCRGGSPSAPCDLERPWTPDAPLTTPDGLGDPGAAVAALEAAARRVDSLHGSLEVAWGDVHRLGPGGGLPGNGATGDPLGVFHVVSYAPVDDGASARGVFGDTWVAAVEFTPEGPDVRALLSYGNRTEAGAPGPRHQLDLLSERRMRPVWLDRDSVLRHAADREPIDRAADGG